jgi:hypothetical protein
MSAQDNLSHALFHGTIETLKPGDLVKPRYSGAHAWATPSLQDAEKHTQNRISVLAWDLSLQVRIHITAISMR